ncbi:MAG TPA: HAMP domain-containing sensor histidine kinase [Gemmatimonadaceae bacterium]|nr:HAMP domain-containing sensor histidine kinase [Gemmatimonadaceae bacterium]
MRRGALVVLIAVGVALLLGVYVIYTRRIVMELSREAERTSRMYARVYSALLAGSDPATASDAAVTLLELANDIRQRGVPVILTDVDGRPADFQNLPFEAQLDDPRLLAWIARLDRENPPIVQPGVGTIHYGHTPLVRSLQVAPFLLALALASILLAGGYALHLRGRAERERVWAGMARESAHQLGTPLSSLAGWVELMEEHSPDGLAATALGHMRSDLERLERVAHRFERIGRPPREDPVDVGVLVERVAAYFRARVPTLAHAVRIEAAVDDGPLLVAGDPVLLEWALEAMVRNSIDALSGRGGVVRLHAAREAEVGVRVRVSDDGPGVPREMRRRIFEPGFTTKAHGWGIGLSLARRIVEANHRGRLMLVASDRGATFDVILR